MSEMKHLLFSTDLSEESGAAFSRVIEMSRRKGFVVLILHVAAKRAKGLEDRLERFARPAIDRGVEVEPLVLEHSDALWTILEVARWRGCDAIAAVEGELADALRRSTRLPVWPIKKR